MALTINHQTNDISATSGSVTIDGVAVGGGPTYTKYGYVATGGQTTFSATYTVGFVDVFLNGIKLANSDFTATSGTSVVLVIGALVGDEVEIISWNNFEVANAAPLAGSSGQDFFADNFTATTSFSFANWKVREVSGSLYFSVGGINKMKLDSSGNLDVAGIVNANATIV